MSKLLTPGEKRSIKSRLKKGDSINAIAKHLGRDKGTVANYTNTLPPEVNVRKQRREGAESEENTNNEDNNDSVVGDNINNNELDSVIDNIEIDSVDNDPKFTDGDPKENIMGEDVREFFDVTELVTASDVKVFDTGEADIDNVDLSKESVKLDDYLEERQPVEVSQEMILEVSRKLIEGGISEKEADRILAIARKDLKEEPENAGVLYSMAISNGRVARSLISKTMAGREGITIMTSTASEMMDEAKKKPQPLPSNRDYIFNPKG